jgi:hypothetical protein
MASEFKINVNSLIKGATFGLLAAPAAESPSSDPSRVRFAPPRFEGLAEDATTDVGGLNIDVEDCGVDAMTGRRLPALLVPIGVGIALMIGPELLQPRKKI